MVVVVDGWIFLSFTTPNAPSPMGALEAETSTTFEGSNVGVLYWVGSWMVRLFTYKVAAVSLARCRRFFAWRDFLLF